MANGNAQEVPVEARRAEAIEIAPRSRLHVIEASSKRRHRCVIEHRLMICIQRPPGISETFAVPFGRRNGRQEFRDQLVKLRRILMVFCAIGQTGISNQDRSAIGYPILQGITGKHSHSGKNINRDLHQSLFVPPLISPPQQHCNGEKYKQGEENQYHRNEPLVQDDCVQNKNARCHTKCFYVRFFVHSSPAYGNIAWKMSDRSLSYSQRNRAREFACYSERQGCRPALRARRK